MTLNTVVSWHHHSTKMFLLHMATPMYPRYKHLLVCHNRRVEVAPQHSFHYYPNTICTRWICVHTNGWAMVHHGYSHIHHQSVDRSIHPSYPSRKWNHDHVDYTLHVLQQR